MSSKDKKSQDPSNGSAAQSNSAFKTFKVELLTDNSRSFMTCIPNATEPYKFETAFFRGVSLILVRTDPIDPRLDSFFNGRKRRFEVQVQGKFKRLPQGEVYVGAEATNKMELGILTRSLSKAAMQFCGTMVADMHYSFGDPQNKENYQLPHVVAPIFKTFDKVIVTPPDEAPPLLGLPFVEDIEYRKARLKFQSIADANVDLVSTYSFSVNTSNIDLHAWTLMGIPMMRPMDLRTFLGSSSIQLVGYEIPAEVEKRFPGVHPQGPMNYMFNMKLTAVEGGAEEDMDNLPGVVSSDEERDDFSDEAEAGAGGVADGGGPRDTSTGDIGVTDLMLVKGGEGAEEEMLLEEAPGVGEGVVARVLEGVLDAGEVEAMDTCSSASDAEHESERRSGGGQKQRRRQGREGVDMQQQENEDEADEEMMRSRMTFEGMSAEGYLKSLDGNAAADMEGMDAKRPAAGSKASAVIKKIGGTVLVGHRKVITGVGNRVSGVGEWFRRKPHTSGAGPGAGSGFRDSDQFASPSHSQVPSRSSSPPGSATRAAGGSLSNSNSNSSANAGGRVGVQFGAQLSVPDGGNGAGGVVGEVSDVLESSDFMQTDYDMEAYEDLRYCPACLDVNDYRKEGRRRILYMLPIFETNGADPTAALQSAASAPTTSRDSSAASASREQLNGSAKKSDALVVSDINNNNNNNNTIKVISGTSSDIATRTSSSEVSPKAASTAGVGAVATATATATDGVPSAQSTPRDLTATTTSRAAAATKPKTLTTSSTPKLRSYSEVAKVLQLSAIPRMHKNKKLTHTEKRRRQIVETLRSIQAVQQPQLQQQGAVMAVLDSATAEDAAGAIACGTSAVCDETVAGSGEGGSHKGDEEDEEASSSSVTETHSTCASAANGNAVGGIESTAGTDGTGAASVVGVPATASVPAVSGGRTALQVKLDLFLQLESEADRCFLSGENAPVVHRTRTGAHAGVDIWEGSVAMATSSRHWIEYYLYLNKSDAALHKSAENKRAAHVIQVGSIISVRPLREEECPFSGFCFFQVETFSRMHFFMVRAQKQLQQWIEAFRHLLGDEILLSPFDSTATATCVLSASSSISSVPEKVGMNTSAETTGYDSGSGGASGARHRNLLQHFAEPEPPYLAKPNAWKMDKRRVYNYRKIVFHDRLSSSSSFPSSSTIRSATDGALMAVPIVAASSDSQSSLTAAAALLAPAPVHMLPIPAGGGAPVLASEEGVAPVAAGDTGEVGCNSITAAGSAGVGAATPTASPADGAATATASASSPVPSLRPQSQTRPSPRRPMRPANRLIEDILRTAFHLAEVEQVRSDVFLWVKFMDEISLLQTIRLNSLSEAERTAFFLNLYHVMVLHGCLLHGPPPAWNYWNAFFFNITYLVGFEIISIAEIEHNILRACMTRPSSFTRLAIPQSHFPAGFALSKSDFRFNFCINTGSKSLPRTVPVYTPQLLDEQLDEMTYTMVAQSVEIDYQKKIVVLPRVPLQDFSSRRAGGAGTAATCTPLDYLQSVACYMESSDRSAVNKMLLESGAPTVRFKNASLRCRMFGLHRFTSVSASNSSSSSSGSANGSSGTASL